MVVEQLSADSFVERFLNSTRSTNFSTEALYAMYEDFDRLSEETGEPFELDIIAICCEYTEYRSLAEYLEAYDNERLKEFLGLLNVVVEDIDTLTDEEYEQALECIEYYTYLIRIPEGGFVIQSY